MGILSDPDALFCGWGDLSGGGTADLYLKKLIRLACGPDRRWEPERLVICMEKLSREATELFLSMAPKLGIDREKLQLLDRKELFLLFCLPSGAGTFDARRVSVRLPQGGYPLLQII